MSSLPDKLVSSLSSLFLNYNEKFIPLHSPLFDHQELDYLNKCIASTYVSSVGEYVDKFEKDLASFIGSKYAIAVSNGTSALHASLIILGVKQNDEVFLPSLTFVATANAVSYCGASPHFIDIDENTLGICPKILEKTILEKCVFQKGKVFNKITGRRISAILPVHTFGHPCQIDEIVKIAKKYNLPVLEDAAEALGSYYKKKHVGNFGDVAAFSFNGNKIITTGGGGMIVTNNLKFANRLKHITTTAKISHKWEYKHDEIGYNYRMPNLNAALGCAQINKLTSFISSKRKLFENYKKIFSGINEIELFKEPKNCKSNYWLQTMILKDKNYIFKNDILEILNQNKFMARPAWTLLHKLKPYINSQKSSMLISENLERRIINIPSSAGLI